MNPGLLTVFIIGGYLALLLGLGLFSSRLFRGTASDYFLASRSIGPFLLLMSMTSRTKNSIVCRCTNP